MEDKAKQERTDTGVLISRTYRALAKHLSGSLHEAGFTDLSSRHGSVLSQLRPEGVRATDLARASGQHKQIVGTIVDELEKLGYVTRQPDPNDRRAKLVVPTERGLAEMAAAQAAIREFDSTCAATLGEERFRELTAALRELVPHLPS